MHTPGPWTVDVGHDDRPYIMADGLTIAKAYRSAMHPRPERGLEDLPGEENARLMASAPELLEALSAMVNAWEPDSPGTDYDTWMDAKAALARARGEQR